MTSKVAKADTHHAYSPPIDGLRAVAVSSVVMFHAAGWPRSGFVGVDIFFVISGFVVSLSMANVNPTTFRSFVAFFYARRFVRIAPALSLCLLATMAAACLFIPEAWLSNGNLWSGLAAIFGFSNIVLAKSTGDYFSPRAEFNPFTHTWSLGVEEQFYVVFPLVMLLFLRSRERPQLRAGLWTLILVACMLSLALSAWWARRWPPSAFYLAPARVWELACGVALYFSMSRWQPWLARVPVAAADASSLVVAALLGVTLIATDGSAFPFPGALPPVLCTAAILALVMAKPQIRISRVLALGPVVSLGKISYSLYLWHWPVFVLMRWTVGIDTVAMKATAVIVSFFLAATSYRLVELPVRKSDWVADSPRWMVIAGGLAAISLTYALAATMVANESRISLSVTTDVATWLPDNMPQLPAFPVRCSVTEASHPFEGGSVMEFTASRCSEPSKQGRLFVVGDSHALAYVGMLRLLVAHTGRPVRLVARAGCPYIGLDRPMAETRPECQSFNHSTGDLLVKDLQSGDIVFLPSLRVRRYGDQWGEIGGSGKRESSNADRHAAVREAQELLGSLALKGVAVVFERPPPIFRSPPFRCSDWFNAANPVCAGGFAVARSDIDALRRPVLTAMGEISSAIPSVTAWDPLPLLCPTETCNAFVDGKPLFFDADHLSGHGNAVLFPAFVTHLDAIDTGRGLRPVRNP